MFLGEGRSCSSPCSRTRVVSCTDRNKRTNHVHFASGWLLGARLAEGSELYLPGTEPTRHLLAKDAESCVHPSISKQEKSLPVGHSGSGGVVAGLLWTCPDQRAPWRLSSDLANIHARTDCFFKKSHSLFVNVNLCLHNGRQLGVYNFLSNCKWVH